MGVLKGVSVGLTVRDLRGLTTLILNDESMRMLQFIDCSQFKGEYC